MTSYTGFWIFLCLSFVVDVAVIAPNKTRAEVTELKLSAACADFAYNPETGSLVALDNEKSEALLFDLTSATESNIAPHSTIKVGESPCSICYKKFGEKHFYIIACSQESSLFILEEPPKSKNPTEKFQLVKRLELDERGISSVAASSNPLDPNVYYCYGGGHDSAAGAISLGSLGKMPFILRDTMDCSLSSSGTVIYHRGPWNPSGFKSQIRLNPLTEAPPVFAPLFSEHRSTPQYLPDATDTYTASGKELYNRNLNKKITTLPIIPLIFFKTKPIVIGFKDRSDNGFRGGNERENQKLHAASINTFELVGTAVSLNHRLTSEPRLIERGVSGNGDFKRIRYAFRVFADELRNRVLLADLNKVFVVDLADFTLPDEPLLSLPIPDSLTFVAENEHSFTFEIADPDLKLSFDDLPDGMTLDNRTLRWKPKLEQIGSYTLSPMLTAGEFRSSKSITINVEFPSTPLPYRPGGFFIDEANSRAIVWEGAGQTYAIDNNERRNDAVRNSFRLSVVDLKTGKIEIEKTFAEPIGGVTLFNDLLLTKPVTNGTYRCDVYSIRDLKRIKSIAVTSQVHRMELIGEYLALQTSDEKILVYDRKDFELIKTFGGGPGSSPYFIHEVMTPQIYANGIVWSADLKPTLILASPLLPALGNTRVFSRQALLSKQYLNVAPSSSSLPRRGSQSSLIALKPIPGIGRKLRLDYSRSVEPSPNSNDSTLESKLIASVEGIESASQVLRTSKTLINSMSERDSLNAIVQVTPDTAYVVSDDRLYRWQFPTQAEDAQRENTPLFWSSKPNSFVMEATGKTVLKHEISGGKPPYSFNAPILSPSIVADEKNGTITIDNASLQTEAEQFLIESISKHRNGNTRVATLRQYASEILAPATEILGRRPRGVPVACPIQLLVTDQNVGNISINYFVLTEVNSARILSELNKLDQLAPAEDAAEPFRGESGGNPIPNPPGVPDVEAERLNRKIMQLEERMEMLTRKLDEVLKKLDERDK